MELRVQQEFKLPTCPSSLRICQILSLFTSARLNGKTGLEWRWHASGLFTCVSAYKMLSNGGVLCPLQGRLWSIKTSLKVRVFSWLLFEDSILTQSVLLHRDRSYVRYRGGGNWKQGST